MVQKISLSFALFVAFYSTIVCGDTYRCLNAKDQLEYSNRPCTADGLLAPAPTPVTTSVPDPEPPSPPKLISSPASKRIDGALCPFSLASQPRRSGSNDGQARELDNLEELLYIQARSGKISWVQLVDKFYTRCAELYRDYQNEDNRELPAYQRLLAEKMDAGSIKESEWIYLQESKFSEIRARDQLIENSRPPPISPPPPIIIQHSPTIHRSTNCTTRREFGGTYTTNCY